MADAVARLYPDVVAAGGLPAALGHALAGAGSSLVADHANVTFVAYARVESGRRFSQVYMASEERLFIPDFWNNGVVLAHGGTPDLAELAWAIDRWVGSGCTTAEMAATFGWFEVEEAAEAFERGEEVEHRWRQYEANIADDKPELAAFVRVAARRPELRQVFPFTSMYTFCFSRCTGYPFTRDTPTVTPAGGGLYEVTAPTGRSLGRGDAATAVELVVRHLPAGCGPAVPGTADDLG